MHACPNCRRHIRESECPFCHATAPVPEQTATNGAPRIGLRRGALVAGVLALSACAPAPTPAYGVPADADTSDASSSDVNTTDVSRSDVSAADAGPDAVLAAYGIPPQDSGTPPDSGASPAYGIPPQDAGGG